MELAEIKQRLKELKKIRDDTKIVVSKHETRRDALLESLVSEFGISSIEDGEAQVKVLSEEVKEDQIVLERLLEALDAKVKQYA